MGGECVVRFIFVEGCVNTAAAAADMQAWGAIDQTLFLPYSVISHLKIHRPGLSRTSACRAGNSKNWSGIVCAFPKHRELNLTN